MQNMLELLGTKEQKQRKFDPRQIQLIKRFENLNDFDRPPDLGEPEVENETDQPRSQRNNVQLVSNQEPEESVHAQFGYCPSGQADMLSQEIAYAKKNVLKQQLSNDLHELLRRMRRCDVKTMIKEHKPIIGVRSGLIPSKRASIQPPRDPVKEIKAQAKNEQQAKMMMGSMSMRLRLKKEAMEE